MKEELLSVIDELKRLKKEGVEQVYVSEDSLRSIRSVAESESATVAKKEAEKAVASIPDEF
jgi:sulfur relay (sulfurtransferase) DsrF/TusC family protein